MTAEGEGHSGQSVNSNLDYWHTGLPPFASVRTVKGLTEIRIRSLFGEPFKRALAAGIIAFLGLFIASAIAADLLQGARTPLRFVPLAGMTLCAVAFFGGMLFLPVVALASRLVGEVIVGADKLILKDRGNRYEIPLPEIRGIRQVTYPGTRLEVDFSGALGDLFFRGKRTALEIEVPDGKIEFFHPWEEPKVTWLAENVNRLVFPAVAELIRAPVDQRQASPRIIAAGMYGKPRRIVMRVALFVGTIATTLSGWYAYRGLSSAYWPSVQGRVVRSHYDESRDSHGGPYYHAEIQYTYQVSGINYTNDDFGFERSPGDDVVKDLVIAHPVGSAITVFYDPARPPKSIVIPGLGPMPWLICLLSLAPFLLGVSLAWVRSTPQQDVLAARYRTGAPSKAREMDHLSAVVRWKAPAEASYASLRASRRIVTMMAVRVIALVGMALWVAHHWLGQFLPADFQWRFVTAAILGMTAVPMLGSVVLAQFTRPTRSEYGISDAGVLVPSKEKPLIPWVKIVSFTVEPHRYCPQARTLALHLLTGERRAISLPGGELDTVILRELSDRLPERPPPAQATPLRTTDWIVGFSAVVLAWFVGAFAMSNIPAHPRASVTDLFLISGLLAGPGTWIALVLRGRRAGAPLASLP